MEEIVNTDGDFFDVLKKIERRILEEKDDSEARDCLHEIDKEENRFNREYEQEL